MPSDRALANVLTKELGGLPLALDQAGAYIEETGCSLAAYQQGEMDAIGAILHAYSLMQRNAQEATLGVHRLVQAVIREAMEEAERQTWVGRTVQVVKEALPEIIFAQWRQCEQYVPHAQACVQEMAGRNGKEEVQVWDWVGAYLLERQRTQEAGPYVLQALSLRERVLGSEHVRTAASLDPVARWWELQGKYAQAEPLVERALAITECSLGPNHPHTQIVHVNVTTLQAMMQSDESASC